MFLDGGAHHNKASQPYPLDLVSSHSTNNILAPFDDSALIANLQKYFIMILDVVVKNSNSLPQAMHRIRQHDDTTVHQPHRDGRGSSLIRSKPSLLFIFLCVSLSESFTLTSLPCRNPLPSTKSCSSSTRLFGIKGFRAWFESQFPDAITAIPKYESKEVFDHVLIDINQLLHVAVRRSTSDDHALAITMRELNACIDLATPRKSLVLAMDGSPSAAKLATSRKRRLSTLLKTELKQMQLERFRKAKKLSLTPQKEKRLLRRYASEVETLRITPGTGFMERANLSLLYWAWQRMISQDGPLSKVSIFISTSESPGEGEVKILDWILRKRPQGSLAIMGGDSDLVLEGLVIPPSICTHNVFVLLPDVGKRYLVVSLWETTRHLQQLLPQLKSEDIMYVRSDMVLLLILNGNDYLPKLRGSSGFNRVFRTYIHLVREWLDEGKEQPFLVDPESLVFNREFAVELFGRLRQDRPLDNAASIADQQVSAITSLGQLNNLVSTQFMPKPLSWRLIQESSNPNSVESDDGAADGVGEGDDDEDEEVVEEEETEEEEDFDDDELLDFEGDKAHVTLRLTIGKKGSADYYCFEMHHNPKEKLKETKNELAKIALDDLMGPEYLEAGEFDVQSMTNTTYPWEISGPVDSDCELYLAGLLWNLQTYQDGICSDYGYNYGKRLSPAAEDVVDYFQQSIDENRQVGKQELLGSKFTPPVKNGVSCLAALPSQLRDLILKPYSDIPSELVEQFYGECVSPIDNAFDMSKFSELCENEIVEKKYARRKKPKKDPDGLKRVGLGNDFWTVVYRVNKPVNPPFEPPNPVIKKFTPLFVNRRVKAARFSASTRPRERRIWKPGLEVRHEIQHSDISDLLGSSSDGGRSIFDVDYWTPYAKHWKKSKKPDPWMPSPNGSNTNGVGNSIASPAESKNAKRKKKKRLSQQEVAERIRDFNMEMDLSMHPQQSIDGTAPLSYLMELERADMIDFEWKTMIPSPSEFASIRPDEFESIQLFVRRGDAPLNSTFDGELMFQRDREVTRGSKQDARQYLASLALTRLLCHKNVNWYDCRFSELKNLLIPDYEIIENPTLSEDALLERMEHFGLEPIEGIERSVCDQTSLAYMYQIHQDKLVEFEFIMNRPSPTEFASVNPDDFECVRLVVRPGKKALTNPFVGELVFERDRLAGRDMKRVKQYLCSIALNRLLDHQELSWNELSYKALKARLKSSVKAT